MCSFGHLSRKSHLRQRHHYANLPVPTACSGGSVGSHLSHTLSLDAHLSQISFFGCFSCFTVFTAVGQLLISGWHQGFFFIHRELSTCQRFPFSPQGWEEPNSTAGENKLLRTVPCCAESSTEIQMRANSVAKDCQHCAAWNFSRLKQEETWHPWYP